MDERTALPILQNPVVAQRTSSATRRALQQRVVQEHDRYLAPNLFRLLEQITSAMLPQGMVGTQVDIAGTIDKRLVTGANGGWRFAVLPPDKEAYREGLSALSALLRQTPFQTFDKMPTQAKEDYLRSVADGDVDEAAQFPLSKWFVMLRTDAVKIWLAHPSTMEKMSYYGFADGESGNTNGPTDNEGWSAITANQALPFEQGTDAIAMELKA